MSSPEHKQKIWNYIKDIGVGMLVTEDQETLRARPMHLVQDEYDGTLWFFTDRDSAKVYEAAGQSVCLTFCDHDDGVHVSLSGHATINNDQALIDKYWSPFVDVWFEGGKEDPSVTLLEIKIDSGEHWDAEDSKIVQFMELAKAKIADEKPDLGDNEKFGNPN